MKKVATVLVLAFLVQYAWNDIGIGEKIGLASSGSDSVLAQAFERRQTNLQVEGNGTVARLLSDDRDGSKHQRFILKLGSGQTLLIAHNIDLAPRIDSLAVGDDVEFFGEYEWNSKGGVIHWTHHDPNRAHVSGWIKNG
jgi:hypothetical protein